MLSLLAALSAGLAFGETQGAADNRHGDVGKGASVFVPPAPSAKALSGPLNISIGQVNLGAFPTIQCFVSVWDAANQGVTGLTAANFVVTEQGANDPAPLMQYISLTEAGTGTGGVSVALVVDRSGSMGGAPVGDAKSAAIAFIDNFASVDRAAMVDFSTFVHTGCQYTYADPAGKAALTNAITPLYADGSTSLNDAILKGIDLTALEMGAKAVIVFTDGGENNSSHTDGEVITTALCSGIPIYAIGIAGADLDTARLQYLAAESGGQYYLAPSAAQLLDAYQAIKAHVLAQYVVMYRTANAVQDKSVRAITVGVNDGQNSAMALTSYRSNLAPQISRTAGTVRLGDVSQPAGVPITIGVDVFDYDPIASARLFYRATGSAGAYQQVAMSPAGTPDDPALFEVTIPAPAVAAPGLDYFVTASDGLLTASSPPVTPEMYPYNIPVMPNYAPTIQHVPVTYGPPGMDIAITATVTDTTDYADQVNLLYRSAATPAYVAVTMNRTQGDTYEAAIPASAVAPPGIDYYLQAVDNYGTASCHGTADAPHRVNYGASDVTVAARWYEMGTSVVITAIAHDRMQGGTVSFGTGAFTVYDPKTVVTAEGSMKYDPAVSIWTSGLVPFNHAGAFTVEVCINGLIGTLSFVADTQDLVFDGTVSGPNGLPLSGATVSLCSAVNSGVLGTAVTNAQGRFEFGPGNGARSGWYFLTAAKGAWTGRSADFFASDSMTVDVELSQNRYLAVADDFSLLIGLLENVAQGENRMLSDMSGSVDNYLKAYGAAGTMLDVVNLGMGTASVSVDPLGVAGAAPFADPAAALRYLNALVGVTGGSYGCVAFPRPWFTSPPFTQDFQFNQWYMDWAYNGHFRSVADGGTGFEGPDWSAGSRPPGVHFISPAELDNDGPFTGFAAAIASTDANLLEFFKTATPDPAFSLDRGRAYIGARINQLNAWRGTDDKRSQIMLRAPESPSSDAVLAMRPLFARYEKDRGAADAPFAAKTPNTGVKMGARTASLAGPVALTVGTDASAASASLDATEIDVKGDLEQAWGLAGPTRLLDLAQLAKYGAGMSEFLQTEAGSPYYLDASRQFSAAIDSVQTSFAGTGLFGMPRNAVVLVDVTARNTGAPAVVNLYAENYATEELSTLVTGPVTPTPLLPFLRGDFKMTSLTDSGTVRSGAQVATDGTVDGHFELLTGAGFLSQLMGIQFVDVFMCNGPWTGAETPVHYNLVAEELKSAAPAKSGEASSMIRTNEKALSLKQAADMSDRVVDQRQIALDADNAVFTGSYTASSDANRIVFRLFHPSSSSFGLMVSRQDGGRVGFDPASGAQLAEFPAAYSGALAHPEEIGIPGAAGNTYAVNVKLAQSAARGAEKATLVVIEEPRRPAVMAFYPQDVVKYATPGSTLTLCTEVAESGKQVPLDGVAIAIGALKNQGGGTLPLSAGTPAQINVPRLMAGTSAGALFTYRIPADATGAYTGTAEISSQNAGTLTQKIEIRIDSQVPDTAMVSAASGQASPVIKWTGSDSETSAGQLRFSWKLDGVDKAWTLPAQATETRYENLANGQYVFHVKAVDATNHEDPTPAEITFKTVFNLAVSSSANGRVTLTPAGGAYHAGTAVSLTAAPDSGYRVKAWTGTDNDALKTNTNTVTVNGDRTVAVAFEAIPRYTLGSSVVGGHGTLSPSSGTHSDGTVVSLTAAPDSGYRVKAWTGTDNDALKTNTNAVTMSRNRTVTVEFEAIPRHTLNTSVAGGHGTLSPATGMHYVGTVVTLTAVPDSGYQIKAWTGTDNDALLTSSNTATMTGDRTVTVEFVLAPRFLNTSVAGGHGTLAPAAGPQAANAVVTLTAAPDSGYRVKTWTGTDNDALKTNANTVTMTANRTVTVAFERITHTLDTSVVGGHGTLAPATGPQNSEVTVTLTAAPDSGYRIKAWTGTDNDALKTNANSVTMTGDKTVTVEFQPMGTLKGGLAVTIQPAEAAAAGAQWSVDGGAPQAGGATVSALSSGQHTVSFTAVEGWTAPADQTVTVIAGQTITATGTYTEASAPEGGGCFGGTASGKSLPGPGGRGGDALLLLSVSVVLFLLGGRRMQPAFPR